MPPLPTRARADASPVAVAAPLIAGDIQGADRLTQALGALLADPRGLADWLRALDPAQIAARSYWHPNGFAKLVLHVAPEFKVRLHVWPAGPDRRGEVNPHGHRWDFASTVLCGPGLRSTTFEEAAEGTPYVRHDYVGSAVQASLAFRCSVFLTARHSCPVPTHARYAITTETVHTIDPLGTDLVATLVVQGRPWKAFAPVYCLPGADVDQPGLPILPTEVRDLVDAVLAAPDGLWEW